jgi:hypothetical protein
MEQMNFAVQALTTQICISISTFQKIVWLIGSLPVKALVIDINVHDVFFIGCFPKPMWQYLKDFIISVFYR